MDFDDFKENQMVIDAVIGNLVKIGEGSSNINEENIQKYLGKK